MGKLEKDFLFQAANSPIGIELESSEPERDFNLLSQERSKDKLFKQITVRRAAEVGKIWLIRLPAQQSDITLEALLDGK